MFTPRLRGTHTGGKQNKTKKSYGCLSSARYKVHLSPKHHGRAKEKEKERERFTGNKHQLFKGPRWNIARMNVLNKKLFL